MTTSAEMTTSADRVTEALQTWARATSVYSEGITSDKSSRVSPPPSKRRCLTPSSLEKVAASFVNDDDDGNTCEPWNSRAYYKRLQTFDITRWFAKPANISARECARHGWICTGPDMITCECCGAVLCFKIDAPGGASSTEESIATVRAQMGKV